MNYKILKHAADISIEATAPNFSGLCLMLARGMIHAVTDYQHRHSGELTMYEFETTFTGYNIAVVDILTEIKNNLYDQRRIPLSIDLSFYGDKMRTSVRYLTAAFTFSNEIKAVAQRDLMFEIRDSQLYGRVLFDV